MAETMVKSRESSTTQSNPSSLLAGLGHAGSASSASQTAPTSVNPASSAWGSFGWGRGSFGTNAQNPNRHPTSNTRVSTGSGLLVESSVSDEWPNLNSSGQRRLNPSSTSQAVNGNLVDQGLARPTSSHQQPNHIRPDSQAVPSSSQRPLEFPANGWSTNLTRPNFAPAASTSSTFASSTAPAVYTKFNRPPAQPQARASDDDQAWSRPSISPHSPVDDRRSFQSASMSGPSLTSSRNNSLPPSRHGQDSSSPWPSRADATDSFRQGSTHQASTWNLTPFAPHVDQLMPQLSNLSLDRDVSHLSSRRPSAAPSLATGQTVSTRPQSWYQRSPRLDHPQLTAYHGDMNGYSDYPGANGAFPPALQPDGSRMPSLGADINDLDLSCYGFPSQLGQTLGSARRDSAQSRDMHLRGPANTFANGNTAQFWEGRPDYGLVHDPRLVQYLATQSQQAGPYPSYLAQIATQPMTHFSSLPPTQLAGALNAGMIPCRPDDGRGVRSLVLEEFKNCNRNNKRWELKDIYNHVVEFSGDQHGSRFIQQKLETANSDEKLHIFQEIELNAVPLMADVFGNYVIQRFFEHGDQAQKRALANKMKGNVLNLALNMYGCRVVQKALDHVLVDQKAELVNELRFNVTDCVKDQNGNHVIQKAIQICPPQTIRSILSDFRGQVLSLSGHSYGCRVIQRCLESCEYADKYEILRELRTGIAPLITDNFGNYVVQHAIKYGDERDRDHILQLVAARLEDYSRHKFASNVVERCLNLATEPWKRLVVDILITGCRREGDSMILSLVKDSFGNYVIQKLVDILSHHDYLRLLQYLQPEMLKAKRTGCCKSVLVIEKKMSARFGPQCMANGYLDSTYNSTNISTNTTPPSLAEHRTPQTSYPASNSGDATEGANNSRKGSEPSNERGFVPYRQ